MGNLRDFDYDFMRIWHSDTATATRNYIGDGLCHCPLANQAYSNILCSPAAVLKVLKQRRPPKTEN
jgi:hypothetical protein